MGRKKLHRTKEELDKMNRIRRNKSYEKNKDEEKKKSLKRYYDKKKVTDGDAPFPSNI